MTPQVMSIDRTYMSYSPNSLKGGYMGDYIREYKKSLTPQVFAIITDILIGAL